ncbi:MAG TPA: ABC transporter permease [Anaerolineaceae bacterium]|nr:ABC transporter permease [Anaerolineaceae bacterium]
MINLMVRNLKLYFRDRNSVFFSLLGVFVIITLYLVFLGDVWASNYPQGSGIRFAMDTWIMAGVLAITSFTTTLGAVGTMVEDKTKKIRKDFVASPLSHTAMTGGYILSTIIVGIIMSLVALAVAEIFIVIKGGSLVSLIEFVKLFGLILLATVANSAIVVFIVSFFNTLNAFGTASTLVGTLIGFFTGIYMPIGVFPPTVQWLIKLFPPSHAASLMRQVMMRAPIEKLFAGAPAKMVNEFKWELGVEFVFGDTVITPGVSILILAGTAVVFYLLALWNLSRKKN